MRNHTVRLYLATITLFVFFTLWATIAAKPWATAAKRQPDPRLLALARRQHRLKRESVAIRRLVARRWAIYERQLKAGRRRSGWPTTPTRRRSLRARSGRPHRRRGGGRGEEHGRFRPLTTDRAPALAPAASTVVTLPPQVEVVTLPRTTAPATSSSSSRP